VRFHGRLHEIGKGLALKKFNKVFANKLKFLGASQQQEKM
jgi:hypothetical protein